MTNPSLEAVTLSKTYGDFTAVSALNLKVEGPKCVGFLGPNGAGKTTTLKIFTSLIAPSSGSALINGVDVSHHQRDALAPCGVLVETPEIYPALTPREALSYVAELRGMPRADTKRRIEEVIDEVRMTEWLDKRVGKFSKGMKQRVNIAAALLPDPDILLLDEPTSGLDPRGMAEVRDIITALKKKNKLIFMSSHLLAEVSDMCDEVAMIDHGKLLVYDKLENVTARFSGTTDVIEVGLKGSVDVGVVYAKIRALPGVTGVERPDATTLHVTFTGGVDAQEKLLQQLVSGNLGVVSFHPTSSFSRLEGAYLEMIKGGY
jgi:ABC-2 type transport system ATP-binding protein